MQHVCKALSGYFVVKAQNCRASTLDYIVMQVMGSLLMWLFSLTGSSSRPQSTRILRPCHPSPECWWWTTEDVPLLCVVIVLYFKVVGNLLKKCFLQCRVKQTQPFVFVRARYRFLPLLFCSLFFCRIFLSSHPCFISASSKQTSSYQLLPSCAYIEKSHFTRVRKFFV